MVHFFLCAFIPNSKLEVYFRRVGKVNNCLSCLSHLPFLPLAGKSWERECISRRILLSGKARRIIFRLKESWNKKAGLSAFQPRPMQSVRSTSIATITEAWRRHIPEFNCAMFILCRIRLLPRSEVYFSQLPTGNCTAQFS